MLRILIAALLLSLAACKDGPPSPAQAATPQSTPKPQPLPVQAPAPDPNHELAMRVRRARCRERGGREIGGEQAPRRTRLLNRDDA